GLLPDRRRQGRHELVRNLRDPDAGRGVDAFRLFLGPRREARVGTPERAEDHDRQGHREEQRRPGPLKSHREDREGAGFGRSLPGMESTGRLAMETGTVKWFNEGSGYGFIAPDDGGNELFVRGGSVVGEEPVALIAGERVEFESRVAGMGPEAVGVRRPRPE